jgi:hypothetical protein
MRITSETSEIQVGEKTRLIIIMDTTMKLEAAAGNLMKNRHGYYCCEKSVPAIVAVMESPPVDTAVKDRAHVTDGVIYILPQR